jgi:hypothetical protein
MSSSKDETSDGGPGPSRPPIPSRVDNNHTGEVQRFVCVDLSQKRAGYFQESDADAESSSNGKRVPKIPRLLRVISSASSSRADEREDESTESSDWSLEDEDYRFDQYDSN